MSTANARAPFFLGVDLGGTNIKAGVVDDEGRSLSHVTVPTEAARGPHIGLENTVRAAEMAIDRSGIDRGDVRGVGLATPGTMDIPAGMLLDPPNLPGWTNFAIRDLLAERLSL